MSEKETPADKPRGDPASSNWGCALSLITLMVCITAYAIAWLIVKGQP